ncbi:hypothetical protein BRAO375_320010 [Bradyrhizobium sp. ORS 375]|uniref:hypothetical protein n=1 Tax=Bradyrhizobium sp. (strain ORS 375) TaxID=566679 RepID=UPI000240587F|nr:hypothetical protein [Bradyrhizobium sp. ORS 375]CCD94177.1 hypothetical protein BRAO375_320010 [Bradyrhizobium sp. ORS 375]
MSVSIKVKTDISQELKWLSKAYENNEGRISWPGGEIDEYTFQVIASLSFTPNLADHEKDDAIWTTINECAKLGKFDQNTFIRKLREASEAIRSRPASKYTLLTQINVPKNSNSCKRLNSLNGAIHLQDSLSRQQLGMLEEERTFAAYRSEFHDDFLFARVTVKARHARSALQDGIRSLQLSLGLLNLAARGYGLSKRMGIPGVPLGQFLIASPAFLLDHEKRKMGSWLSDSDFPNRFKFHFTAKRVDLKELSTFTKRWIGKIERTDFSDRFSTAITLFQEALSARQVDIALIKFWTCIELLTSRPDGKEPLERAIARASSIFIPPAPTKTRLEFIANSRHALVHKGGDGEHALLCAQWASIYAGELLGFSGFNAHGLTKHSEILEHLSTPLCEDRLRTSIRMSQLRLKALSKRSAN